MEAEEATALEAVTRRKQAKIQQIEKALYML
jgi:cell division protein FtsL